MFLMDLLCYESHTELPPISTVITELRRQDPYIQQEQHRYRSPRGFQHWPNHLAYAEAFRRTPSPHLDDELPQAAKATRLTHGIAVDPTTTLDP